MDKKIHIGGLDFFPFLSKEEIQEQTRRVAEEILADLGDRKPLFVITLKGAFIFAADLLRAFPHPCEACFVRLASYSGTQSTGTVRELMGLTNDISGRDVIVVEDIVDTGRTMKEMIRILEDKGARSIRLATLLLKPGALKENIVVDYAAFRIPNRFVVGYGLDYDEAGRNLPEIYATEDKEQNIHKTNNRMKNIVIFGAPGSGKGTQSDKLVEKYGFKHISTGDVLRGEIAQGSELGKTAKSFIDEGKLIPDSLMIDILASVYDTLCPCEGVIFDGFPRTIPQAEALKKMLGERGAKVDAMLELDVPDEELMARLINRGKTSGRADDNEETIKKRLAVYKEQTAPLIAWYQREGQRNHIKGYGDLEEIFSALSRVIDNL